MGLRQRLRRRSSKKELTRDSGFKAVRCSDAEGTGKVRDLFCHSGEFGGSSSRNRNRMIAGPAKLFAVLKDRTSVAHHEAYNLKQRNSKFETQGPKSIFGESN